jgi:hypothetical protein
MVPIIPGLKAGASTAVPLRGTLVRVLRALKFCFEPSMRVRG